MSYHMCTGSPFPAAYHSPLTEKCDYNNKITDIVFSSFSFLVYLVFGLLVVYETVNRKVQEHQNRSRSSRGHSPTSSTKRLQILVDSWPLLLRLIFCITAMEMVSYYQEGDPDDFVQFPGNWYVYIYYLIYLPMFRALERYYQIMGHESLRNHLKRRFGQYVVSSN